MRHPQLLVFEHDGRLAWLLKAPCAAQRWSFRQPRQIEACLRLLSTGGPAILVVRLTGQRGKETEPREEEQKWLERACTLMDRAHARQPDTAIIAVSERDQPALAALAWDLGATYVLAPPQTLGLLPELVQHMMAAMTPAKG